MMGKGPQAYDQVTGNWHCSCMLSDDVCNRLSHFSRSKRALAAQARANISQSYPLPQYVPPVGLNQDPRIKGPISLISYPNSMY